jgi:hypothetical protein
LHIRKHTDAATTVHCGQAFDGNSTNLPRAFRMQELQTSQQPAVLHVRTALHVCKLTNSSSDPDSIAL